MNDLHLTQLIQQVLFLAATVEAKELSKEHQKILSINKISNTNPLRKHILTAAHCFDKRSWRGGNVDVRIGQDDIREDEWVGTNANIARVKIHERYGRVMWPPC